jgi:hypothetical protein
MWLLSLYKNMDVLYWPSPIETWKVYGRGQAVNVTGQYNSLVRNSNVKNSRTRLYIHVAVDMIFQSLVFWFDVAVVIIQEYGCVILTFADWNMKSLWTWSTSNQHWLLPRVAKIINMIMWLGMSSYYVFLHWTGMIQFVWRKQR